MSSVRPSVSVTEGLDIAAGELEEYVEEDGEPDGELEGEIGERIALPKEDEFVRKVQDPILPSKEVVDMHYIKRAHSVYELVPCVRGGDG